MTTEFAQPPESHGRCDARTVDSVMNVAAHELRFDTNGWCTHWTFALSNLQAVLGAKVTCVVLQQGIVVPAAKILHDR